MTHQTLSSLLMVAHSSMGGFDERRRAEIESMDSDLPYETRLRISEQRMRLRLLRPAGKATVYHCHQCQIHFRDPSKLMAHHIYKHIFSVDPQNRKLPCPICHRRCRSRRTMAAHVGTHLGERLCKKCGAEFASSSSAAIHKRLHRGPPDHSSLEQEQTLLPLEESSD
ncbi:uncharacterized protein LOC144097494 [Amblyomma americanum]